MPQAGQKCTSDECIQVVAQQKNSGLTRVTHALTVECPAKGGFVTVTDDGGRLAVDILQQV